MGGSGQNRVRSARLALGMSQAALAAATRLSRQSIGAIEAGRATPAVDVALRIATTLEASVEELFGARNPQAPLVTEATSSSPTEAFGATWGARP
jgi:DNA-binding XRE family transcriptional regulator